MSSSSPLGHLIGPKTHSYTVGRLGGHLCGNQGWITTPELKDLLDSVDLVEATAHEVVYNVSKEAPPS